MKNIILIDRRIEKIALFEMNLKIYLGATVKVYRDLMNLSFEDTDLAIINHCENEHILSIPCPVILLTKQPSSNDSISVLPPDCDLKSLIQAAASILGVTAKDMAKAKVPDLFPIPARLIRFLLYAPFDLYTQDDDEYSIFLNQNDKIPKDEFPDELLYIKAINRVRFADSFSDQLAEMKEKLSAQATNVEEKITCLDQTMEVVGSRLQYSGIDDEVILLAKESINSLVEIASKYEHTQDLISNIFNQDTSFRYKNAQLMLFVSFHVIKTLDWWIENQRNALSSAIYFHDILLDSDQQAQIRHQEDLSNLLSPQDQSFVMEHPYQTAQLIKTIPDISQEAYTIILEHHADPQGKSFQNDPTQINPLAKVFFICEIYCNQVLLHHGVPFDEEKFLSELEQNFTDQDSVNIISALKKLNLNEIIKAVTSDIDNDLQTVGEQFDPEEQLSQAISVLDHGTQDELAILRFATDNISGLPDIEQKKIIKATTQIIDQLEKTVVKDHQEKEDDFKQKIEGITEQIKEATIVVKGCIKKANQNKIPLSDIRDHSGRTKLMIAALSGNPTLLETILAENTNIKLTDATRKNALHYACFNGSIEIIERLIGLGVNINGLDAKRRTPLFYAINSSHYEATKLLLEKGAWPNVISDLGITLPILAAHKGELEILKILHQYKAPMHSRDHRNKDALDHAQMSEGNEDIIEFLSQFK